MRLKIDGYNGQFKIVSLALDECTKQDLLKDELDIIYVSGNELVVYPEKQVIELTESSQKLKEYHNYDVFELWENGTLLNCYDDSSTDNYFFVTGQCNSNCVMCPSPDASRKDADMANIEKLINIANHISSDAPHLTITGGEPFMAGEKIFDFIRTLKDKFDQTEFLLLTNGRIFAIDKYVELLKENAPEDITLAIPIHGSCSEKHDAITQAKGSFNQTLLGVKKLLASGFAIEIRLVACNLNVDDFGNIANLIVDQLPGIKYVSVMAPEMTGSAYINRDRVWKPYSQIFTDIEASLLHMIKNGIDVKLYNFPLCTVSKKYRTLCEKSISPNKIRFAEVCERCKLKDACGGIFAGTFMLEKDDLKAIL